LLKRLQVRLRLSLLDLQRLDRLDMRLNLVALILGQGAVLLALQRIEILNSLRVGELGLFDALDLPFVTIHESCPQPRRTWTMRSCERLFSASGSMSGLGGGSLLTGGLDPSPRNSLMTFLAFAANGSVPRAAGSLGTSIDFAFSSSNSRRKSATRPLTS